MSIALETGKSASSKSANVTAQACQARHTGRPAGAASRPRLLTSQLTLLLLSSFGALTSFYLMLSVTPMAAASAGAGTTEAGLVTASLMLATVMAELASARFIRRYGDRVVFAVGALMLGGPAVALLAPRSVILIVAVSIARGVGFGFNTVVIGTLVAAAVPAARRGEGIAVAGVVACLPAIVALPSGVWLTRNLGYTVVIGLTAAFALAPLALAPWLSRAAEGRAASDPDSARPAGLLASVRAPGLRRPALVFAATTVSAGVIASFLPLVPGVPGGCAALGLFMQAVAATVARWLAGRYGDRHGHAVMLVPGLLTAAAGMLTLMLVSSPVALIAGTCLFGIGFGCCENVTFALMIDRVPAGGYETASALWNLAYDGGYGVGPAGFGTVVGATGYPMAFALTGVVMLVAVVPALRDTRQAGHASRSLAWTRKTPRPQDR